MAWACSACPRPTACRPPVPRDYKHRAQPRRRRRGGVPGWLWLLAGLAVGLFVAFLVWLGGGDEGDDRPVPRTAPGQDAREVRKAPRPAIPPPPKPRFEFYELLPDMEVVVVPEEELGPKPAQGVARVEKPGTYVLQAGSFRSARQADELRARLALMGLESRVQAVTLDSGETWHRVRVGPFRDLAELNRVRAQLAENHIEAILLRARPEG